PVIDLTYNDLIMIHYFFFQAEDGIRDRNVTGVQTCALPILFGVLATLLVRGFGRQREYRADSGSAHLAGRAKMVGALQSLKNMRSEERRVGKECMPRWSP